MSKNVYSIILCLTLWLSSSTLVAGQLVPQSIEEQIASSQTIVTARVIGIKSHYTRGQVHQHITLDISEKLKGQIGQQATLIVPGGETEVNGIKFATINPDALDIMTNQYYVFYLSTIQEQANTYRLVQGTNSSVLIGPTIKSASLSHQKHRYLSKVKAIIESNQKALLGGQAR